MSEQGMAHSPWIVLRSARPRFTVRVDRRVPPVAALLVALTLIVLIWNTGTGEYPISPVDVVKTFLHLETGHPEYDFVVNTLRLPRALVAFVVGAMLALAGCVLQTLTRNPLASPDITGVTAGAALGALCALIFLPKVGTPMLPLAALVSGLITAGIIYVLAWRGSDSPLRLLLIGIGLTALLSAFQSLLFLRASPELLQRALYWLTGSIYARSWEHLYALLPWCLVLMPVVLVNARNLNTMQLGDDVAQGLGANVTRQRALLIFASVALTAAAISQVGMLGFVGLIAPHMARKLVGPLHEGLLFTSMMLGGLLIMAADFAGRTIVAPAEVPAGIMIALIGAPFFVFLLWKNRESL